VVSFLNTPQGRGRMRAIYEFTGGNHRLLVVFYEFLTSDSVAKLSYLFIQALDPLKPFYQEQMRSLSAQQQKIIQFLSLQRRPCTVKEIARACLAAPNTISSQLKDLLDKNFVDRIGQGRESYYEIAEALFRICYEAELEHEGAPVRLFVDFLGNLYAGEELRFRYRGFSLLANRPGADGHIPFAEEAEAMYRKALELEPGNASAWARLSLILETLGRIDDAAAAFQEAERLGADRVNLLNSRGKARQKRGEYMPAISDYEEALQADPQAVVPHFKIVSALLALGRIEDALGRLSSAIVEADRESKTPCSSYVTRLFLESCLSLFEHAPTASFDRYLTAALDIIGSDDPAYMQRFEESLPLTIFALLKDQENISEVRFSRILKSFENVIGKRMEASVAVRFLKTGIEHFKNKDKKALLRLTKEERRVFSRELGIRQMGN
jgi:tetratricopeptide (TPR) repeat protein